MVSFTDAQYLKRECEKLDIKVTIVTLNGEVKLDIMDQEFDSFDSARRFVQGYQIEQGARWAAYKPKKVETKEAA